VQYSNVYEWKLFVCAGRDQDSKGLGLPGLDNISGTFVIKVVEDFRQNVENIAQHGTLQLYLAHSPSSVCLSPAVESDEVRRC